MPPKKKAQRVEKGPKDDGSKWVVVNKDGLRVYRGDGLRKADAERLAAGLVQEATIECVKEADVA